LRLSDTSLIVTWLTDREGKLRTAARGARRLKNPIGGRIDLFSLSEITVVRSRSSDLHSLRESIAIETFEALRANYLTLRLASYFVKLLDETMEPEFPAPELFHLLQRALEHLCISPPTLRILQRFELRLAVALGIHDTGDPAISLAGVLRHLPRERGPLIADLSCAGPCAGRRGDSLNHP
jgi:DNA repair protein RecO (recombination protein O)